jgi:mRNA interferase YafQ
MYRIVRTRTFERSYRKLKQAGFKRSIINDVARVIDTLALGKALPRRHRDHKLAGHFIGYRECHIRADLLLIYQIDQGNLMLILVDIGSHPYLFGG